MRGLTVLDCAQYQPHGGRRPNGPVGNSATSIACFHACLTRTMHGWCPELENALTTVMSPSQTESSPLVSSSPPPSYDSGKELLLPHEERWRDRQTFLASHGYILRQRLRPNWIPSWKSNGLPKYECEDGIPLPVSLSYLFVLQGDKPEST